MRSKLLACMLQGVDDLEVRLAKAEAKSQRLHHELLQAKAKIASLEHKCDQVSASTS